MYSPRVTQGGYETEMDNLDALRPMERVSPKRIESARIAGAKRPQKISNRIGALALCLGLAIIGCGGGGTEAVVVPPPVDTFAMVASAGFSDVAGITPAPPDVAVTVGAYSNDGYRRSYAFGPSTGRFSFSIPETLLVDGMKFPVKSATGVLPADQGVVAKLALGTTAEYEAVSGSLTTVLTSSGPLFTGRAQFQGLPTTTAGTFRADAQMQHAGITILPKQDPPNGRGTIYRSLFTGGRNFVGSISGVSQETIGIQEGFRVQMSDGNYFILALPSLQPGTYPVGYGANDAYVGYTVGETQYAAQGFGRVHIVVEGSLTTVTLTGLRFGTSVPIEGGIDGYFVYNNLL